MTNQQLYDNLIQRNDSALILDLKNRSATLTCFEASILALAYFSSKPDEACSIFQSIDPSLCVDPISTSRYLEAQIFCEMHHTLLTLFLYL